MQSPNIKLGQSETVVYVVIGRHVLNDRAEKVLNLRMAASSMVLVAPNEGYGDYHTVVVRSYPNPTGILRLMGMPKTKQDVDRFLFFPSIRMLYVKPVQRKLKRRIRTDLAKGKAVVVLTCVPPHDVCLIGLSLKRAFPEIHWVVDWQDLWSFDENYFERAPLRYRERLLNLERQILHTCDLNITTNDYAKTVLEQHYSVPCDRVSAIPHHFSSDDLAGASKDTADVAQNDKQVPIKIGFLGTLFKPPRVPGELIHEALREINKSGLRAELHVHGNVPRAATKAWIQRLREDGLIFHGRSSHRDSVKKLLHYDYLLLLLADLPNSKVVMSIKLPHYMLIGIPIIAVVPQPSAVSDIIRETGAGYVIPINADWRPQLIEIIQTPPSRVSPPRNEKAIHAYSWDQLSARWVQALCPARRAH